MSLNSFKPVTVVNQTILEEPFGTSIQEILFKLPRGVYSVARTVTTNSIVLFDSHVDRLRKSDKKIFGSLSELVSDRNYFKELLVNNIQIAFRKLLETNEEEKIQKKSVLIFISDTSTFSKQQKSTLNNTFLSERLLVLVHVYPMMKVSNSVKTQIYGQARKQPNIKDTKWVKDRKKYLDESILDEGEILLTNDNKEITEGATSNFFVIMNSKVYTAKEDVILCGIMRKLTINVCKKIGLEVIFENPRIETIDLWEEAFLTSSSRNAVPVSNILYENEEGELKKKIFTSHKITKKIQANLLKQMEIESDIIDL
ncbi:d-aminoacid aminotransferase-like plp-dependent enzymes superfamily protein [Anaeramoeba flamelloides]|uniref:D-aminoacid aminotransferase-like plp-dependent enzymes superfamily protein n=1 Tax=Anaeramoeba flamelloides TaxID=1746091 RepID=A0AAV7ZQL6_9EUKA|nr:d-aminoacid aminotransferase-like plp-dependent enzymes superfamily protein [Anaeramoeba flamelloides]KAJ6226974.1 d-aminoacid aminotransferase-like plp-dependent enzymes superfamily protein [Anaeramoeba flamelloides]